MYEYTHTHTYILTFRDAINGIRPLRLVTKVYLIYYESPFLFLGPGARPGFLHRDDATDFMLGSPGSPQ